MVCKRLIEIGYKHGHLESSSYWFAYYVTRSDDPLGLGRIWNGAQIVCGVIAWNRRLAPNRLGSANLDLTWLQKTKHDFTLRSPPLYDFTSYLNLLLITQQAPKDSIKNEKWFTWLPSWSLRWLLEIFSCSPQVVMLDPKIIPKPHDGSPAKTCLLYQTSSTNA